MNLTFGSLNIGDVFSMRVGTRRLVKVSATQRKFENDDTDASIDTVPSGMSVIRIYNAGGAKSEFRFDDLPLLTYFRLEAQDTIHRKQTALTAMRSSDGAIVGVKRFDRVIRCTEPAAQLAALFPTPAANQTPVVEATVEEPAKVEIVTPKANQTIFRYLDVGDTFTFFGDEIFSPPRVGVRGRPPARIPECYKGRVFVKVADYACEVNGDPAQGRYEAPARSVVLRANAPKKAAPATKTEPGETAFRFLDIGQPFVIVEANWGDKTIPARGNKPLVLDRALKGVTMRKTALDKATVGGVELTLIGNIRVDRVAVAFDEPPAEPKPVLVQAAPPVPNSTPLSFGVDFVFPKSTNDRIKVKIVADDGRELTLTPEDAIAHGESLISFGQRAIKATKNLGLEVA